MRKEIANFIVNGKPYEAIIEPRMLLIDVLRDQLGLTGTKYACGTGDCGACTVLVDGKPVFSCLTLAVTAKGKNILTVEGLAEGTTLHPIQQAFIDHGAVQCGFCTPGMILSAKALLDGNHNPARDEGGAAQGLGLALSEDFVVDKDTGETLSDSLATYKILSILDIPEMEVIMVEKPVPSGPFGAKGVGEPGLVNVAPAIANALYDATGVRVNTMPLSPEKVLEALKAKKLA